MTRTRIRCEAERSTSQNHEILNRVEKFYLVGNEGAKSTAVGVLLRGLDELERCDDDASVLPNSGPGVLLRDIFEGIGLKSLALRDKFV